jgi:glycosyltransferase involved in cell wall biosynthesis
VGDGFERTNLEAEAARRGVSDAVVFTGSAAHDEIPQYVAAMDVALVTARAGQAFHYSPLKMREYLAAGVAVVAPRIGEIPAAIADCDTGRLYLPGDAVELGAVLRELYEHPAERARIARDGQKYALRHCTWDVQLSTLLDSAAFAAALRRRHTRGS